MRKMNENKKNKLRWALTIGSICLSVVTLIALCVGLGNITKTKTLKNSDYAVGSIDASGKIIESKQNIYTKDAYSVDGMTIEIDEDATITYKVAFYDEKDAFISMTDAKTVDFVASEIPATAKTFRVIVTPNPVDGEPVEVTFLNSNKYTSQLEITYNK